MDINLERTSESIILCFQDLNLVMRNCNRTQSETKKAFKQMEKLFTMENQKNQMDLNRYLLKKLKYLWTNSMKTVF